ncbi:uncharacterized protein K452DRAFT_285005 [Aplosporella prunicola CBS 121167]|uniref:Microbial-type PARG catalytic domain-containing protein n=1 Tax=Aplosporella prunicola CBS 121167 TaxID=1176127 RepID=A0A6A6BQ38_9PEZI|nr:uncharacterized protein K452DRAFT_285005 [Aplosporella prunicola CBS 121167]KAF2144691.1 hypothetical protein K452DRAFT_285005 [Aplosporella prunicola CBS 121167]
MPFGPTYSHASYLLSVSPPPSRFLTMPPSRPRPSEIAAEAKRTYIPYIERQMPEYPAWSALQPNPPPVALEPDARIKERLRVAIIDGDPVDVALDWYRYGRQNGTIPPSALRIPVVNMANERRAGGDWESGLLAPEECFARRSNLVRTLLCPWGSQYANPHYPIPQRGGIYSPHVVVYRDGPEAYHVWREFRVLPVISVAPVRRPKLDETGCQYSFEQEKELMLDKMRTVLRMTVLYGHRDLCLGAFGVGPGFRNPAAEVAKMWKGLLFHEEEFQGAFANVVFAIETSQPGNKGGPSEYEIFKQEFDPSNVFRTTYRQ